MSVKVIVHPSSALKLGTENQHIAASVTGFISWSRLIEVFRETREIASNEEVEGLLLRDNGIQFYVRNR